MPPVKFIEPSPAMMPEYVMFWPAPSVVPPAREGVVMGREREASPGGRACGGRDQGRVRGWTERGGRQRGARSRERRRLHGGGGAGARHGRGGGGRRRRGNEC